MHLPLFRFGLLFSLGALFALLITPLARQAALWLGAIDQPSERRIHVVPMPRLGGVAIYLALGFSLGLIAYIDPYIGGMFQRTPANFAVIVGATMVLAVGIVDDCRSVSPWTKLIVEVAAAILVVAAGFRTELVFGRDLGWWGGPVSVFWIVTVVNGVNLIDGLDGLAVGAGLISSVTLFAVSIYLKDYRTAVILAALTGTLAGFLYYNFHPALLFLGDSGALLIGFLMAVVAIVSSSKSATVVAVLAPALAVGFPVAEVILTTLRRMLRAVRVADSDQQSSHFAPPDFARSRLFTADREHLHHRLLSLGITHRGAVVLLYGVCLTFGLIAFALCYRSLDILLLLAGAAAIGGAFIPPFVYRELVGTKSGILLSLYDLPGDNRRLLSAAFDFGFVVMSWLGAFVISSAGFPDDSTRVLFHAAAPILIPVQMGCLIVGGLYRQTYRYVGLAGLLAMLRPLVLAAIGGWVAVAAVRSWHAPPAALMIIDVYLLATMVFGSRLSFRALEYLVNAGQSATRRVLIYGAGTQGVKALHELMSNPQLDLRPVGFLDDDAAKFGRVVRGLRVYPGDDLAALLAAHEVEEVLVAADGISGDRLQILAEQCGKAGARLRRFQITLADLTPERSIPPVAVEAPSPPDESTRETVAAPMIEKTLRGTPRTT
ncbi:MAG: hypothetical protein ACLQDV_00475 [Candidatus Binataceae bacterium]